MPILTIHSRSNFWAAATRASVAFGPALAYNTPVDTPVQQPDLDDALATLTRTLADGSEPRLDVLLRAARDWTGARHALLTVFGPDGPRVHAASAVQRGEVAESALLDPALELSLRAGAIVRYPAGAEWAIAVPIYRNGEVAGALEVRSDQAATPALQAVPALQVLAGIMAASLGSSLGGATGPPVAPGAFPSLHDPVTGLPARALLFDRLHQAIQLAHREEAPIAVLLLALTHFRDLASRLDADAMQTVVQEFARRTRATLRASDTVARADQDSLAVLLPGANAIGALGTVKKILRSVGVPLALAGQHVSLQANAGIAIFPEHGEDAEALLERAGAALHQARESGQASLTYGE